jgi:hypothetical protein
MRRRGTDSIDYDITVTISHTLQQYTRDHALLAVIDTSHNAPEKSVICPCTKYTHYLTVRINTPLLTCHWNIRIRTRAYVRNSRVPDQRGIPRGADGKTKPDIPAL